MLKRIAAATTSLVSLTEAKAQCRVDHSDDDTILSDLIEAASEMVEHDIGLALQPSTWTLSLARFANASIDFGPIRDVDSVSYYPVGAAEAEVIEPGKWAWEPIGDNGRIWFGNDLPDLDQAREYPVSVSFKAGFNDPNATAGEGHLMAPKTAKQAILLLVGHWYQNRESVGQVGAEVALTYDRLTDTARKYR